MTTADYALIVSILSVVISLIALGWNIWQKFLFVKPDVQVTFGLWHVLRQEGDVAVRSGKRLLMLAVVNMGPGPVVLTMCIARSRKPCYVGKKADSLNPIHGDPTGKDPAGIGPFGGGLPAKIDSADSKVFYFPYEQDCFLKEDISKVGICDSYRRSIWCRRGDVKKVMAAYKRDFGGEASGWWLRAWKI